MGRRREKASTEGLLTNMEARPRKDGLVTYRYRQPGGKHINLGTDLTAAMHKALDMNRAAPDAGTVGELWRTYQDSPDFKRLAESTKNQYRDNWEQLKKLFKDVPTTAIKPADVARYLRRERSGAPVVANREVALLSNLMNLAVEQGDIDRNPCKEVRRNKETPRTRLVEKEELQPFVDWALKQGPSAVVLVSMAQFCALTGNRRMEFLNLHWPQVDDEIIRLHRGKQHDGKTKRELVAISGALQEVLDRMRAQPGYNPIGAVFRAPRSGNPYTESGFKGMWGKLKKAALAENVVAENFTFHDLRAHYTTYFKLKFAELPELHSDAKTTSNVYERSRVVSRKSL